MFRLVLILILILPIRELSAQPGERSFYGGVMYKRSGIGLAFQNMVGINEKISRRYDLEFTSYKHLQEVKTFNTEVNNPTPYVYGKLNKAAVLKLQYLRSFKLSQFTDAQRVGVDLNVGAGFIVGFLKPVYLNLVYPDNLGSEVIVAEKYDPVKHNNKSQIIGYSDGRLGWNEITTKPGVQITTSIGFTWGYYAYYPKRLEAGFYIEYFNKGLPVMALTKNKPIQEGIFIKLFIGKRMTKN